MRGIAAALLTAIVPVSLTGCGTVCNLAGSDPRVYGGVQKDVEWIQSYKPSSGTQAGWQGDPSGKGAAAAAALALAIPVAEVGCSVVGDTLTLPVITPLRRIRHPDESAPSETSRQAPIDNPERAIILEYLPQGSEARTSGVGSGPALTGR